MAANVTYTNAGQSPQNKIDVQDANLIDGHEQPVNELVKTAYDRVVMENSQLRKETETLKGMISVEKQESRKYRPKVKFLNENEMDPREQIKELRQRYRRRQKNWEYPKQRNTDFSGRFRDMPPTPIDETQLLYKDYLQKKNCDCELISNDGRIIKMHASILRKKSSLASNGPNIESENLVISLDCCDHTIYAFVDYLYLGYDKFLEKYGKPESCTIPIFALVDFAHKYNQLDLFECCVAIIYNVTAKDDAERVLNAATKFQNYHLAKHYESLINQ